MALLRENFNEVEWHRYFGLCHQRIESSISQTYPSTDSYVGHGLTQEALYTQFSDYLKMFKHPLVKAGQTFVDVGAGLGKGTLLCQALELDLKVLSLEYVWERHRAGKDALKRLNLNSEDMMHVDLMIKPLPQAQHYFIYLPTGPLLSHIIEQLKVMAQTQDFHVWVIESHGDLIPTLKKFAPHLELLSEEIPLDSERHCNKLTIFKSSQRQAYEHEDFTFQNEIHLKGHGYALVEDCDLGSKEAYLWLASLKGISMGVRENHLQVFYPNREFHFNKIQKILDAPPTIFKIWCDIREEQKDFPHLGAVRKIITSPTALIEFSNGTRLPLKEAESLLS